MQALRARLEAVFEKIERERMRGLPFLNQRVRVEATPLMDWQGQPLGVLVTPWFMNLMVLSEEADKKSEEQPKDKTWRVGEKVRHVFPSGEYEFTVGAEDEIGQYQMCSLFSPMDQFESHEAAMATAQAVMEALMDEGNQEKLDRYHYWEGDPRAERSLQPEATETLSRRTLLTGRAKPSPGADGEP